MITLTKEISLNHMFHKFDDFDEFYFFEKLNVFIILGLD